MNFREQLKSAKVTEEKNPDFVAKCGDQFLEELIAIICNPKYQPNVRELLFCIEGFAISVKRSSDTWNIFSKTAIADRHDVFNYIKAKLKAEAFVVKNELNIGGIYAFTAEFN